LSKEAQSSGIMSGFDMDEMEGDVDENADMEEMPPMARTPQNPEILMNTLRGDMRSVDARYMELAQMVGEEAAMETPPEVLAMLMGKMGAQQGGIGALPQGQAMAPPGAMPPGAPPPGAGMPPPPQPQGGMPPGMGGAMPPFPQGGAEQAPPQQLAEGGSVEGDGMLNLQVPISVGGGGPAANPFPQFPQFAQPGKIGKPAPQYPGMDSQGPGYGTYGPAVTDKSTYSMDGLVAPNVGGGLGAAMGGGNPYMDPNAQAMTGGVMQPPRFGKFADGGAVDAPATPDGMPPMYAAVGAFVNPAMRAAQFVGDKASKLGSSANAALGRMFMTPQGISQPYLENLRGAGGKFTAEQVQRGGNLMQPTFTQGLQEGVTRLAEQYPRAAQMAMPAAGALGLAAAPKGGAPGQNMGSSMASQIPTDSAADLVKNSVLSQPAAVSMSMDKPITTTKPERFTVTPGKTLADIAAAPAAAPAVATTEEAAPEQGDLTSFINDKLSAFDKRQKDTGVAGAIKEAVKERSKMDRIRESQAEYAPLYEELLGGDKESAKVNALLLLSEAGLKLAGSRKPTFAMALAEAASGLPRGFAAIAAQERELGMKVKSASLQQAIGDVDAQDKYAQALKLQLLKGDYELLKEQAKQSGGDVTEDAGMGLRTTKTKNGTFVGTGIDPEDPVVKSAVQSRFTLRDTDNPFVENRGAAPTTLVTDKSQRLELGKTLTSLENSLKTLDGLKGVYVNAYGPGAWFSDKVNNLLVPIDPTGATKPNLDFADAYSRVKTGMNSITKSMASANDSGRVAVQEQEWARQTAKGLGDPEAFFKDKEVAAKGFASTEAMLRNARQQVLTQLGYEANDYVMSTPNTGTKNDPFIIPKDPSSQKTMFTFLGSTIGKLQDPRAMVHLRMPNGTVQQFNPTQLRALNQ